MDQLTSFLNILKKGSKKNKTLAGIVKTMTLLHSLDHSKDEKSSPLTDVGCRRPIP